ncbi:PREDICTED: uncharacterized protein LOC104804650 [Tarenaya hassleriana]|uniref:uncharacterized protein LOC104804650 n=1 Tax=Tarenaya hassleriana TaxID=28532 RepID=UPI00053C98AD|nr:PREDICTED: uncharacterized protein LOC104804650 [Tarenaya hassleriana]
MGSRCQVNGQLSKAIVREFHAVASSSSVPKFSQTLTHISISQFLSPCSVSRLKHRSLPISRIYSAPLVTQRARSKTVVLAVQSNFLKVLRTAWNIGRDGVEAGTKLIPVGSVLV